PVEGKTEKERRKQARSVLAAVAQSVEQRLLLPAFELAMGGRETERSSFDVMLRQHDGFTVRSRRVMRRRVNRLKTAVRLEREGLSEELGVPEILTELEVKHGPAR